MDLTQVRCHCDLIFFNSCELTFRRTIHNPFKNLCTKESMNTQTQNLEQPLDVPIVVNIQDIQSTDHNVPSRKNATAINNEIDTSVADKRPKTQKNGKSKTGKKKKKSTRRKSVSETDATPETSLSNETEARLLAFMVQMDGSVIPSSSSSNSSNNILMEAETDTLPIQDEEMGMIDSTTFDKEMTLIDSAYDSETIVSSPIHPSNEGNSKKKSSCPSITATRALYVLLFLLVVTVSGLVPFFLLRDDAPNDGIQRLDSYKDSKVVTKIPRNICNDSHYALDTNEACTNSTQDAPLCDLIAQAMMNVTGSDMALINAGICRNDIRGPTMTVGDIRSAVTPQTLMIVETTGRNILRILELAMETVFGNSDDDWAYPYAAGLRFVVKSNRNFGSRIELAEINVENLGLWRPINPRRFYKIVTTRDLAKGGSGYDIFAEVVDHWKTPLSFTTGDVLLHHALKYPANWWDLAVDHFSTQSFVGPDVEPIIATVPEPICLEWTPVARNSSTCSGSDTIRVRGGGACGLIAWGMLDQNLFADVALIKASFCGSDIPSGDFTRNQVEKVLPQDQQLVTVRLTGKAILLILNRALEVATEGGVEGVYPYVAALRYAVNKTATVSDKRISSAEVMTATKRWIPLAEDEEFSVLTTKDLADGEDAAYRDFLNADATSTREMHMGARQAFMDYATEWGLLYQPLMENLPTQRHAN